MNYSSTLGPRLVRIPSHYLVSVHALINLTDPHIGVYLCEYYASFVCLSCTGECVDESIVYTLPQVFVLYLDLSSLDVFV